MSEYQKTWGGVEEPGVDHDSFYSKVMSPIDVINNILRNFKYLQINFFF